VIGSIIQGMVIDMNETRLCSLEQLQAFVDATAEVRFLPCEGEDARYAHIEAVLKHLGYRRLGRKWVPRAFTGSQRGKKCRNILHSARRSPLSLPVRARCVRLASKQLPQGRRV
jgi:hypothetical protein